MVGDYVWSAGWNQLKRLARQLNRSLLRSRVSDAALWLLADISGEAVALAGSFPDELAICELDPAGLIRWQNGKKVVLPF
jgi:hypothetical protein